MSDSDYPPMFDDPQSGEGSEDEPSSIETGHTCELCGCDRAAWAARLGKSLVWTCRNCGMTSYLK